VVGSQGDTIKYSPLAKEAAEKDLIFNTPEKSVFGDNFKSLRFISNI